MKKLIAILVFLISSIAITGIAFIDGKIWEVIFRIVGMIAYAVVGGLFSIGILQTKNDGKYVFGIVFILLILSGYGVYKLLEAIRNCILSWPLFVKILVLSIIVACIGIAILFVVRKMIRVKKAKAIKESE